MDNKQVLELAKQAFEVVEKTPQLQKLIKQCREIANGQRKEISETDIDDAFDVMEILIKDACKTPDEFSIVQKLVFRDIAYRMILNQNVYIRN